MAEPGWYRSRRHEAVHALTQKNRRLAAAFNLDRWALWDYDLKTGTLVFSHDGRSQVVTSVQVVGSVSLRGQTWLWAWANDYLPAEMTRDAIATRDFGSRYGITELTTGSFTDD